MSGTRGQHSQNEAIFLDSFAEIVLPRLSDQQPTKSPRHKKPKPKPKPRQKRRAPLHASPSEGTAEKHGSRHSADSSSSDEHGKWATSTFNTLKARRTESQGRIHLSSAQQPAITSSSAAEPSPVPDENSEGDLHDFLSYLASEIFESLPVEVKSITAESSTSLTQINSILDETVAGLPSEALDSLRTYHIVLPPGAGAGEAEAELDLESFFESLLVGYFNGVQEAAAEAAGDGEDEGGRGCALCGRSHIPLTVHHLVPRSVVHKAVKRGWHTGEDWRLASTTRICRACHSKVHSLASNEELAQRWYSVELLLAREDMQRWVEWCSKVRWKKR